MYAVGRLSSYISQGVYTVSAPFHPFGGAVDIIVVEQPDGSFKSSPWYIKFGKFQGVLKTKEKIVNIGVNGVEADFHMYLDHKGEAYFLREVDAEEIDSTIFSPPSSGDETDDPSGNGKTKESKNYDFNVLQPDLGSPIEFDNRKIMVRTNSRRSRIFGMFGRKSVKENIKQEEGGADAMERVSSMDCAEIAANLLDLKWSTNLPTDLPRKNWSRLPSRNTPAEELDKDSKVNDQELSTLLVHDSFENKVDDYFVQEANDPLRGQMEKGSVIATGEIMCSNGASSSARSLMLDEQDRDTSTPGTSVLDEKFEVISKTSTRTSKINLGNATVENIEESEFVIGVPLLQNSHTGKHEGESDTQNNVEEAFDERLCVSRAGVPNEESENLFVPCEASENSRVGVPSNEEGLESSNLSQGDCNEAQVHPRVQCKAEKLISEVNSQLECAELMNEDTSNTRISTSEEYSDKFQKTNPIIHYGGSSVRQETNNMVIESHSLFGVHLINSKSGNGEVLELVHQETITERLCSALDYDDHSRRSVTGYLPSKITHSSNLSLESSGEDQFIFSDIDDFVESEVRHEELLIPDPLEIENNTMDNVEDLNGPSNLVHESHSSSVNSQPCSPNIFEPLLEESTTATSSPMSIPRSRKAADGEAEWTIESLPNFRSYIDSLEMSDVRHPLSHSLDSHSENLRQELLRKEVSSSLPIDLDSEHQLAKDALTMKDTQVWEEFINMLTTGTVEISLCKHMLYEGMGSDAASKAFDTEKLDLEKCASLGPQFMKNDNLIVRIGGRYFPWDAAASYIVEMISLGRDQILEPGGMIAVDLVNKTIRGESSGTDVAPGGSWTLWPFSRRSSRAISPVQPASDGTSDADGVNALESLSDGTPNKSPEVLKVAKKKVKSIVPTTEQLATLNLKEGRNVITFTFSTAMLGKQQVDARIYLWKWNTRIVISDVDGTITRSDVLGQFMPLVGKDWSHIGVTHLFSAIKENGYQLLFLSARAISQAHLTRQFLYNLKQDGKALPDGPVVISPDGLFPSLFREVIRRAPHEFKIACLQDIRALFPPDRSPFYAGFGNRITDEISYLKLGIPKGKIFIINAKGEVAVNRRFDRKSYTSLHALVDGMFPATSSAEQEDFNSWNYWKVPLPEI